MIDISLVTVITNDKERVMEQLRSVHASQGNFVFEVVISDNGSIDGGPEAIRKEFPEVQIVENKMNIGFGAANNHALPLTKGSYILFLNPDMRLEPDTLIKMKDWMEAHPTAGIASCRLLDERGRDNLRAAPRRFPRLFDQLMVLLKIGKLFPSTLNGYLYKGFDFSREQDVDSVRGSFMLMRREIVEKLGWAFDPRYFIWFEDVDICREVWRLGYKVVYTPVATAVDYVGQTFKRIKNFYWKQKCMTESMLRYFRKWEPWYIWIWIAVFRIPVLGAAYFYTKAVFRDR